MKSFLGIILAALVLCFYAFYNQYPLVYDDTGTYILSGFQNFYPDDRPVFYGLFIRHISLKASLFLVVFTQGLIVASLIYLLFKNFSISAKPLFWTLSSALILTLTTGISFNVSQLIPDVFTPVCCLCFILLVCGEKLSLTETIYVSLIFVFSTITHLSNILTLTLLMGLVVIYFFIKRGWNFIVAAKQRFVLTFTLLLSCYLIVPGTHFLYDNNFVFSYGSHIFRMEKLIEYGIMDDFLKEHCNENKYSLCQYKDKDEFIWGFMWDPNSPAYKDGGWKAHEKEYNQIIHDVLSESKYLKIYIKKSIESVFIQFFTFETGDATKAQAEGSPSHAIDICFHTDFHLYWGSKQTHGKLEFETLNKLQLFMVFFSALFILFLFYENTFKNSDLNKIKFVICLIVVFLFLNALVCSNFSGTIGRYQSRVIWLLPLFSLVVFSDLITRFKIMSCFKKAFKNI